MVIYGESLGSAVALAAIERERCTAVHGVPTMYSAMLAHPERARYDTSSLRSGLAASLYSCAAAWRLSRRRIAR